MKTIEITNKYKRHLRSLSRTVQGKNILNKLEYVIDKLMRGERLETYYRDHLLSDSGSFIGQRECHLSGDTILVYILERDRIILNQIGSHSEVYDQNRKRAKVVSRSKKGR